MFATHNTQATFTITVIFIAVCFFTSGKFRSDIIALFALLSLMLTGILTPQEALSGFANPIILTIVGMFVIGGAIVRTGLANVISARILSFAGTNQHALFMLLMLVTGAIGSIVSNTGTVAIMMPIVVSMATSLNASPSRFLMPLAFMSSMGGMLTLIGNPPNMVVNDVYVKAGYESLTLFSFLPIGIICSLFGLFILAPVTSYFLARRKNEQGEAKHKGLSLKELADKYQLAQNMYKVEVPEHSSMAGQTLRDLNLTSKNTVFIHEIRREKSLHSHFGTHKMMQIDPGPQTTILPGDTLYVVGALEKIQGMVGEYRLRLAGALNAAETKEEFRFDSLGICELILMSSSSMVNRTVTESGLREQYGITILGIQRGDAYILENVKDEVMRPGDAILVQGTWENIGRLNERTQQWVVVGSPQDHALNSKLQRKIPFVTTVLLLMVTSMGFGILPTVTSVMLAALALITGGCFKNVEEAYSYINWETIVLIAAMLPLGIAMDQTGIIAAVSTQLVAIGQDYGPFIALALVYAVTSALNVIISSTPVALLTAPVAINMAISLGCSPLPFIFAVATASCMCFASPFSTPSNALVMSAGRYTVMDYLKIGLPMQALLGVVMVYALPILFPF